MPTPGLPCAAKVPSSARQGAPLAPRGCPEPSCGTSDTDKEYDRVCPSLAHFCSKAGKSLPIPTQRKPGRGWHRLYCGICCWGGAVTMILTSNTCSSKTKNQTEILSSFCISLTNTLTHKHGVCTGTLQLPSLGQRGDPHCQPVASPQRTSLRVSRKDKRHRPAVHFTWGLLLSAKLSAPRCFIRSPSIKYHADALLYLRIWQTDWRNPNECS